MLKEFYALQDTCQWVEDGMTSSGQAEMYGQMRSTLFEALHHEVAFYALVGGMSELKKYLIAKKFKEVYGVDVTADRMEYKDVLKILKLREAEFKAEEAKARMDEDIRKAKEQAELKARVKYQDQLAVLESRRKRLSDEVEGTAKKKTMYKTKVEEVPDGAVPPDLAEQLRKSVVVTQPTHPSHHRPRHNETKVAEVKDLDDYDSDWYEEDEGALALM